MNIFEIKQYNKRMMMTDWTNIIILWMESDMKMELNWKKYLKRNDEHADDNVSQRQIGYK